MPITETIFRRSVLYGIPHAAIKKVSGSLRTVIVNTYAVFIKLLSCKPESKIQMMELSQLEELKKIRTELEDEARSLKEEQRKCEEAVKELEEKIPIAELKRDNKLTRDSISQLRNKMNELDQKLRDVSQTEEASASQQNLEPEATALEAQTQTNDEVVTVTAYADSGETQQEQRNEPKKRRFF